MLVQRLSPEMLDATVGMTPLVSAGRDPDDQNVALDNATITITDGEILLSGQDSMGEHRVFGGDATVVFSTR